MSEAASGRAGAVALSYRNDGHAPVVVAKGYGVVAESIMCAAREHGLYVHASPELIRLLMQVQLDRQVPPPLYAAVAEVLAWLWEVDQANPSDAAARKKSNSSPLHVLQNGRESI